MNHHDRSQIVIDVLITVGFSALAVWLALFFTPIGM